jgi:hypothetical protein
MDHQRFDALARRLARRRSRRGLLADTGRAAVAAVLAGIGLGGARARAQGSCGDEGCPCLTGSLSSCVPGLVCCPDNLDLPGGSGTCTPPSLCFGGLCSRDAVVCPPICTRGTNCAGCCSGFCGFDGLCGGSGACRSVGCECITGTLAPCDDGLACCPIVEGLLGGPGICAPRGVCG